MYLDFLQLNLPLINPTWPSIDQGCGTGAKAILDDWSQSQVRIQTF